MNKTLENRPTFSAREVFIKANVIMTCQTGALVLWVDGTSVHSFWKCQTIPILVRRRVQVSNDAHTSFDGGANDDEQ